MDQGSYRQTEYYEAAFVKQYFSAAWTLVVFAGIDLLLYAGLFDREISFA